VISSAVTIASIVHIYRMKLRRASDEQFNIEGEKPLPSLEDQNDEGNRQSSWQDILPYGFPLDYKN
jgi:hypothetical protein